MSKHHTRRLWRALQALQASGQPIVFSLAVVAAEGLVEASHPTPADSSSEIGRRLVEEEFIAGLFSNPKLIDEVTDIPAETFVSLSPVAWEDWLAHIQKMPSPDKATWTLHNETLARGLAKSKTVNTAERLIKNISKEGSEPATAIDEASTALRQIQAVGTNKLESVSDQLTDILLSLNDVEKTVIPLSHKGFAAAFNRGLRPGQLVIIGAPASHGKSTLASSFATDAAENGFPALYFSYEMSKQEVVLPILSRLSGLNSRLFQSNVASLAEADKLKLFDAAKRLGEGNIGKNLCVVEAGATHTTAVLRSAIVKARTVRGLDDTTPVLSVVDYMQLMGSELDSNLPDSMRVAHIVHNLKEVARETKSVIVAISDVTKEAASSAMQGERPSPGVFKDSGRILHSADILIALQAGEVSPKGGAAAICIADFVLDKVSDLDPVLRDRLLRARSLITRSVEVFSRASILKQRAGINNIDVWSLYRKSTATYMDLDGFIASSATSSAEETPPDKTPREESIDEL